MDIKLLFVFDNQSIGYIGYILAKYFRLLGYESQLVLLPDSKSSMDEFKWADLIFVPDNKTQVKVNIFVNPLGCPHPKKIINLKMGDVLDERDENKIILLVDDNFKPITDIILKTIQRVREVPSEYNRICAMMKLFEEYNLEFHPICERVLERVRKINQDSKYYKKECDDLRSSIPYDD